MKNLLLLVIFIFPGQLFSQEREIPGTDLKVSTNGKTHMLSAVGEDKILLSFEADTFYMDQNEYYLIFELNDKYGIIDPWDVYIIENADFSYYKELKDHPEYVLAKNKSKYNLYYIEGFDPYYSKGFDTLISLNEGIFKESSIYIIKNKGKFGLVNLYEEIFEKPIYNEIKIIEETNDERLLYITKGRKKGVFSCDEYDFIIEPKYKDIELFLNIPYNNFFKLNYKGKYGLSNYEMTEFIEFKYDDIDVILDNEDPENSIFVGIKDNLKAFYYRGEMMVPCIIEAYKCVGKPWPHGYIIIKSDGKYDLMEDTFNQFKPNYDKIEVEDKGDKIFLHLHKGDKIDKMEISK